MLTLARITEEAEIIITYQRLQRDHRVLNIIDLIEANGEAKGEAKGIAKGKAETILGLVQDGLLSRATAEARLRHLHEQGQIDGALLAATVARLPA